MQGGEFFYGCPSSVHAPLHRHLIIGPGLEPVAQWPPPAERLPLGIVGR